MLDIRPSCENCGKNLPPHSTEAKICSFECTFCTSCTEVVLVNVCPNCGGGFVPRPIRPKTNWKNNNNLMHNPASSTHIYKPIDPQQHANFAKMVKKIPPSER